MYYNFSNEEIKIAKDYIDIAINRKLNVDKIVRALMVMLDCDSARAESLVARCWNHSRR